MLESALQAGFISAGIDVKLAGPIPTPAVSFLTATYAGQFGVVISASHNPFEDNGIKFFNRHGRKISAEIFLPCLLKNLIPLSSKGLWLALITTPNWPA